MLPISDPFVTRVTQRLANYSERCAEFSEIFQSDESCFRTAYFLTPEHR